MAEPQKKKKRLDPKKEQRERDRLKKKLKKMERAPLELVPIEDFQTPVKCLNETKVRPDPRLPFEVSEGRAMLMKEWSLYKLSQYRAEMDAVSQALEAQREALDELRLESEELYQAATRPDALLFPFSHQGPCYTPPKPQYDAPEGKYNDITREYIQGSQ